jgi:hypothetical protein
MIVSFFLSFTLLLYYRFYHYYSFFPHYFLPILPPALKSQLPVGLVFLARPVSLPPTPFANVLAPIQPFELTNAVNLILQKFSLIDAAIVELVEAPPMSLALVPLSLIETPIRIRHGPLDALALNMAALKDPGIFLGTMIRVPSHAVHLGIPKLAAIDVAVGFQQGAFARVSTLLPFAVIVPDGQAQAAAAAALLVDYGLLLLLLLLLLFVPHLADYTSTAVGFAGRGTDGSTVRPQVAVGVKDQQVLDDHYFFFFVIIQRQRRGAGIVLVEDRGRRRHPLFLYRFYGYGLGERNGEAATGGFRCR